MNKVVAKTLKGFRDFFPEDVFKREYLKKQIVQVFELYGFEPIETPSLEYLETFSGNIGEDEKLFFKFKDQGGREVALRYDQTVTTCRFIAQYKDKIKFPFKRYQLQNVWRAEKPQQGRYREFLQCDADIFGVSEPEADAEMIALTLSLYKKLGFKDFLVKVNDRALFAGIPYPAIVAIDKLEKIGKEGVLQELVDKGFSAVEAKEILNRVLSAKTNETIDRIFSYLKTLGFSADSYVFAPSLARSFSYSTGPIWEVVIPGFAPGSVLGGERFDKLVGRFQNEEVSGTGFAVGFDRTLEAMEQFGLLPAFKTTTKVLVTVFGEKFFPHSLELTKFLRENKINTDIYLNKGVKLAKQIKYASSKKIKFVLIIGEEEVQVNKVTIKNLETGQQQQLSQQELLEFLNKD